MNKKLNNFVCPNPKCITNHERMETNFLEKENGAKLKCHYCEKTFSKKEVAKSN